MYDNEKLNKEGQGNSHGRGKCFLYVCTSIITTVCILLDMKCIPPPFQYCDRLYKKLLYEIGH